MNPNIKVIKTEEEYEESLALLESLMSSEPGSPEADLLEVLSIMLERYEEEHFPIDMPDPIEAIKFRMDQQGLKQKDLIPFIGSASKVSDVLNHRRQLSKKMIRLLHTGLGIPYEVLLQDPSAQYEEQEYFVEDYPFKEMVHSGYFPGHTDVRKAKLIGEELLTYFFNQVPETNSQIVLCKHGAQDINQNALKAWQTKVILIALDEKLPEFNLSNITDKFLSELLQFSKYQKGILMVKEHLNCVGINFILKENLPGTYLDGASFLAPDNAPVIALTLRHDRLDNFWFTLFHEIGHLLLHLSKGIKCAFFDEINDIQDNENQYEIEANQFARDFMITPDYWQTFFESKLSFLDKESILAHAADLGINPAIIAGRVRWSTRDYSKFSDLLGYQQVRKQFQLTGEF